MYGVMLMVINHSQENLLVFQMASVYRVAWFVLTVSCAIAKPLNGRMSRSTDNDRTPFFVPSWLQIYQSFFSNVMNENIIPELKETNIEVSDFIPYKDTLENNVELLQSEDIGDSDILSDDGISEWEKNNIGTELDINETVEQLEGVDDAGTDNVGQSVEVDDNFLKMIGTPWGVIQNLREIAEEIHSYEIESYDDKQTELAENLQEIDELDATGTNGMNDLGSDNMATFDDINNMLNDDATSLDVADVHENVMESNTVDDRDSTIEVAGMGIPSAADDLLESEGAMGSNIQLEGTEEQDRLENSITEDNSAETLGVDETSERLTGNDIVDIGDNTLETGGMEFPTNEGVELPDMRETPDDKVGVGSMDFSVNEGVETNEIIDTLDSTLEVDGMEFPTGANAADDSSEHSPVKEPAEFGFDSGAEFLTVNDETNSEVSMLPAELNLENLSVPEGSIFNHDEKNDFPKRVSDPLNGVEDLKNDEPIT